MSERETCRPSELLAARSVGEGEGFWAELVVEEVLQEYREGRGQEFVLAEVKILRLPPAAFDEPSSFIGCGFERSLGCCGGGSGKEDVVDAVVGAAFVVEAAFADPESAAEVCQDYASFLGYFSACGGVEVFIGVETATGEFPPVVGGVGGVEGMDEQDAIGGVQEQDTGADAGGCDAGGHGVGWSSRSAGGRGVPAGQTVAER
ncbi:hypothetical protein JOD54_004512 [Actinokineospora baliensis]|nr:hypothetical protein [Actinokineospora baliensis]